MVKVPSKLKVHPKTLRIAEELRQSQRGAWRDASAAVHDFIHPLIGYMDSVRQIPLRERQRFQELLQQHVARMGWLTVCGNSNHTHRPDLSSTSVVIIDYFHINRSSLGPTKAEPKLIIDPQAVLTLPFTFQRFQTISPGYRQVAYFSRRVKLVKLAERDTPERSRTGTPRIGGVRPLNTSSVPLSAKPVITIARYHGYHAISI
jgi:hypothetical protein